MNLHMNGDTNFHSRVLECLASGSAVLSEAHPTDNQPGGLRSLLPEEAAPAFHGPADLAYKMRTLLADTRAREEGVRVGKGIVEREHTYFMRVLTLL